MDVDLVEVDNIIPSYLIVHHEYHLQGGINFYLN